MVRVGWLAWISPGLLLGQTMTAITVPEGVSYSADEQAVVVEINRIRQHPKLYAEWIKTKLRPQFDGKLWRRPGELPGSPPRIPLLTEEGLAAVDEAIKFLETVEPCPPLTISDTLAKAAMDHVKDQGPTGQTGHKGTDGSSSFQRMERRGTIRTVSSEIISYGPETPRLAMVQLVIDDGVPDRGHRKAIFNPELRVAGPAIGPHKTYGQMTVVDMADDFTPLGGKGKVEIVGGTEEERARRDLPEKAKAVKKDRKR